MMSRRDAAGPTSSHRDASPTRLCSSSPPSEGVNEATSFHLVIVAGRAAISVSSSPGRCRPQAKREGHVVLSIRVASSTPFEQVVSYITATPRHATSVIIDHCNCNHRPISAYIHVGGEPSFGHWNDTF
ncbi:hypothetical protein ACLOJK_012716 [Asimina triloba]